MGASFIIYSQDFPTGGDFYNFMQRMGPVIEYTISNNHKITLRYLWTHVSHGTVWEVIIHLMMLKESVFPFQ